MKRKLKKRAIRRAMMAGRYGEYKPSRNKNMRNCRS